MTKDQAFSTREWLLTITLLMGAEAAILQLGYTFKEEQSVINYVSFAATIAALLLAVLAIIYGYVQSSTQQQSAAALATQVHEMRGVQAELNAASGSIGQRAGTISESIAQLSLLSDTLADARQSIEDLKGGITGLREDQKVLQSTIVSLQAKTSAEQTAGQSAASSGTMAFAEVVDRLFSQTSFQADLMSVALVGLYEKRGGTAEDWTAFVNDHYANPVAEVTVNAAKNLSTFTAGAGILQAARAFGIVKLESAGQNKPSRVTVPQESIEPLRRCAEKCRTSQATSASAKAIDLTFA